MQELTFNIDDRREIKPPTSVENFHLTFGNQPGADLPGDNWVQGRQNADSLRQVFVNIRQGSNDMPYNVTGFILQFAGRTAVHSDGKSYRIIDNSSVVVDGANGRMRFTFPAAAFAVAGTYKQAYFRLIREADYKCVATLEFDLSVVQDFVFNDIMPSDWVDPFNDVRKQLQASFSDFQAQSQSDLADTKKQLQAMFDQASQRVGDTVEQMTSLGATVKEGLQTAQTALEALQLKIQQDGLFTQAEADQFKKSVLSVTVNSFENVDAMSKSTDLSSGTTAKTQGYYAKGDGGAATYRIVSAPTDFTVKLDNGLYADPVKESVVTPNMFGARDNVKYQPSIDSTDAFRKALEFSDRVSVPEGSYKVQGLNIPAKKVLAGAGQFATILYGYGDDVIKFTESSYNNVLSDLQINADAGFAAVHCKYAPASGDPFDAHNRIENVRTSGGKYGFSVEYPSRGVMIVNGYASGVSNTLFYIQGTDNNLLSCGGQDAPIGYELQNNNTMSSCSCFQISDRAVILRGSWCQVTSFAGQDCQSGFYIPSQSNMVTGKLDRMGYYTPGSKSYDVMLTETSRNNSISLSVTEGRQQTHDDKDGKSYVETILNVSNAIAAQNIISITASLLNDVTPTLCNRASEDLFVRNNDVYINGKLLSDLRYSQLSRKETVDVTVADGGTFTPSVAGQLIITTNHTEDTVWAVCAVKTQAYINGYQQYLYAKHGFGRLGETVQVPVSAGETVVFQQNNSAVMTMSAKFVPYK